jgi:hypothetical protein
MVKLGHVLADTVIDAQIGELRHFIAGSEQRIAERIAELEELKHATLEDKRHALQPSFSTVG